MEVNIKIGGEAGFGIMASGLLLIRTFARAGLSAVTINDYPSLIRGGHNVIHVRAADHEIFAADTTTDILIALNRETVDLHIDELNDRAIIIYDGESFSLSQEEVPNKILLSIPLMKLSKELGGDVLMRNTIALGATLSLTNVPFEQLTSVISDQFGKKGQEIVDKNVNLAKAGYDYVKNDATALRSFEFLLKPTKQLVITGNEAIGLGAVAADMKFFAAYPMTPINGLLYYLAGIAEKVGFIYKQPEDEISGINMAIGASFAGVRSMVATSGGGFSLMAEATSFAGMIEQPVVIIYGQRPGPATGLPTWTTQGDLHFVLNAGQGEFLRLVLAPGDMEEAYTLTATAFNLADRFQTPVFVLVDKYICESYFTVSFNKLSQIPISIDRGKIVSEEEQAQFDEFPRYKLTSDGISPRPLPGRKGGVFRENSDEHNELGYSIEDAKTAQAMIEKRMQKMIEAQKEVPPPQLLGPKEAEITVVGWGSTKGILQEVIQRFESEGKQIVNYLHIAWINPFPADSVKYILSKAKRLVMIEGNHNAQMADLIFLKTGIKITEKILRYDGRPFEPNQVKEYLESTKKN